MGWEDDDKKIAVASQCMKQWFLDVGYRMEVTHEGFVGDVLAAIVTGLGSGLIMTRTAKDQKCLP